jgi:hypothetical protein
MFISIENQKKLHRGFQASLRGSFLFAIILTTVVFISLVGCGGGGDGKEKEVDMGLKKFNEVVLNLRQKNNGFLSKEDIDSLQNLIPGLKSNRLKKWISEDQVIMDSLAKYLVKEGMAPSERAITDPVPEGFNINFFIKNTANMNGYIKRGGQFQNALFGLLADLKSNYHNSEINLHHVNTKVSHKTIYGSDDAVGKYIYNINDNDFTRLGKENGGNTGSTDFEMIFGHVLETVNKNNIAVLVADFIFSPGGTAPELLEKQRNGIRVKFDNKLKELDLAVLVLKMEADFSGNYWANHGKPVGIFSADKRPYYIWFIGSPLHLAKIAGDKKLMTSLKNNKYTGDNMVFEFFDVEKQPKFKIAQAATYSLSNNNSRIIKAIKPEGKFVFHVEMNFNDPFRDSAFFANAENYKISNDAYELSISQPKDNKFTHRLTLNTVEMDRKEFNRAFKGDLKISVMGKIPNWVDEINSTDDTNIKNDISQQGKTYGFKHIVQGAYSAFYPTIPMNEPHVFQTLNLNIQLEGK